MQCSITGKSAHYTDIDNPDWVPTLHLGYVDVVDVKIEIDSDVDQSEETEDEDETMNSVHPSSESREGEQTQMKISLVSTAVQTDGTITGMSDEIFNTYKEKIAYLEEKLATFNVHH